MNGTMRTCPTTGLRVHAQADALIKANAVLATLALLVGGVTGLLVLLTRWQAVHLLDVVWFYRLLMLAWALWLAAALIRWLKWGWDQFSSVTLWKSRLRRVAKTPPPIDGKDG